MIIGNKYKVIRKLGKGSYSNVYECISINSGKTRAIKKLESKNKKYVEREIEISKLLCHKNIIKIYQVINDNDGTYLLIDYCKYKDLKTYLESKRLTEHGVQIFMKQIRDGLKYLYDCGIVHRDLKLRNILLTVKNVVKITDFGLASFFDNESDMFNTTCGSPVYMAPEILNRAIGKGGTYSINCDLWSTGVILYELLFNSLPYYALDMKLLIDRINNSYPSYEHEEEISLEYYDLLERLLEKDPNRRISWKDFFEHEWFSLNLKKEIPIEKEVESFSLPVMPIIPIISKIVSLPIPIVKEQVKQKAKSYDLSTIDDYFSPPPPRQMDENFEDEFIFI